MKSIIRTLVIGLLSLGLVTISSAQTSPASPSGSSSAAAGATNSARTDVYHVHFAHADLGKAAELGESLKTPAPDAPMPDHFIILRHQQGDTWDYVMISHYGTKMTIEAARQQQANARRDLSDWHNDTVVNGPPWSEFTRALGIGDDAKKTSGSVYAVSVYRVAPGHRDEAEKMLGQGPAAGDKAVGNVLMQHLEGSPWQYLSVVRYNSWQDFAATQTSSVPETGKKDSPWSQLRQNVVYHTDTLCDRLAP
jgi:hypothetical protein